MTPSVQYLILVCLLFVGCGSSQAPKKNQSYAKNAEVAYKEALEQYYDDQCAKAQPAFKDVAKKFPYSRFAALAELRAADCMIKQGSYAEGVAAYEEFTQRRPSHAEVPYAQFKIAEAYYKQLPDSWLLSPPAHEKDQANTYRALKALHGFIVDYPQDTRVPQVRKMIKKANELLAKHEWYLADFYIDHDKFTAAASHLEKILEEYPGTSLDKDARELLNELYAKHGIKKPKAKPSQQEVTESAGLPES